MRGRRPSVAALALLSVLIAACQGAGSSPQATPIQAATVTDDWLEPLCDSLGYGSAGFNYLQTGATSVRSNELENAAAAGRLATNALREAEQALNKIPPWEPGDEMVGTLRDQLTAQLEAAGLLERAAEDASPEAILSAIERTRVSGERMDEMMAVMARVPGFKGCI